MRTRLFLIAGSIALLASAGEVDRITLGDAASEEAHGFADGGASYVDAGALERSCRRMRKPEPARWRSDAMSFRLKVAESGRTYLTMALWGGDTSHDHLFCTIDGKMLGQMHLGEYDILDYESCWPRDSNRETADAEHFGVFTYRTFILPESLTKGKREIAVSVYAAGHVWGYGANFEQFQKMVLHDSRGIYAFATHTEAFWPGFGSPARVAPTVPQHAEPDMESLCAKVDKHVRWLMEPGVLAGRLNDAPYLGEAYKTKGCAAYRNEDAVKAIVAAADAEAWKERREPKSVISDGTWVGAGRTALALGRIGVEAIASYLDEETESGGAKLRRRELWCDHYLKSVEYLTTHRRYFANQSQILDTNAHWCNRALKMCDEKAGPALDVTLGYVKEAMGLRPMPNGYVALTPVGLSKEDGYVGSYGESTIWAAANAYEASDGDDELLGQLRKCSRARLYMRYPGVRRDGRRVARLESQISWRNEHFPPPPTYLANNLDIHNAVIARDPMLVGAVRDMYDDGVLAEYVRSAKGNDISALRFLSDWPTVKRAIEKFGERLPHMPLYGGDFTWCDSENAVVVAKRGDAMLFVEAYWRARGSINNLAKVHLVRPGGEWVATVACEEVFKDTGKVERMGDFFQYGWMGKLYDGYRDNFGNGGAGSSTSLGTARGGAPSRCAAAVWPPKNATAGAPRPVGNRGGRADFYKVDYGPFSVMINDGDSDVVKVGAKVKAKDAFVGFSSCQ